MTHTPYHTRKPFDFQGLRIRELTPAAIMFASIAEIVVPPGEHHGRARSPKCDKLYVCLSGEVLFQLDDREYRLPAGDVLGIPHMHWFAYRNEQSAAEARLLLLHVPPFELDAEEFA